MAVVRHVTTKIDRGSRRTVWEGLTAANNVGSAEDEVSDYADKTVQFTGTFNAATALVEGSNDGGTTWWTLNDAQGDPLSFTAPGGALILENPQAIRVSTSGGGGSQDIDAHIVSRR